MASGAVMVRYHLGDVLGRVVGFVLFVLLLAIAAVY
jgi:hypothetical protein